MLAKLMKYEIKATSRWFLPLYVSVLIFSLINRFTLYSPYMNNKFSFVSSSINNPAVAGNSFSSVMKGIISALSMFIYVTLFIGLFVATLIVVIQRYYKSLLGDEGYLMFTLPVNSWQHILNKLLVSMLWCFLSTLVAICSILILIPAGSIHEITNAFRQLKELFGIPGIINLLLFMILGLTLSILQIYSAISLGHLFNKHKLLLSFAMYLGIDAVKQFISLIILAVIASATSTQFSDIDGLNLFKNIMGIFTVFCAVFSAGHFFLTSYLTKWKLNLE